MCKIKALSLVFFATMALSSCSASRCNVEVYLDPEIKTTYGQVPSLEVDIAGVNAVQAQRLQKVDLDTYFAPNNPQRKSLSPLTFHFSDESLDPIIVEKSDEHWDLWKERGAQFIAVICNLPQFFMDSHSDSAEQPNANGGVLAGEMAEMANENSAIFNDGRVLLINMHDGFFKDSSKHLVQISVDGLFTLKSRPENYLQNAKQPVVRTVQDLKQLEQLEQVSPLENLEQVKQMPQDMLPQDMQEVPKLTF